MTKTQNLYLFSPHGCSRKGSKTCMYTVQAIPKHKWEPVLVPMWNKAENDGTDFCHGSIFSHEILLYIAVLR